MRIHVDTSEAAAGRLGARVEWEEATRDPVDLSFRRTDGGSLSVDGDPWLVAAWLPAWQMGERRILIDAPVCPLLRANLIHAVGPQQSRWFRDLQTMPRIEADDAAFAPASLGVGGGFSGGVDSLSMFTDLLDRHPPGSSSRPRTAVFSDFEHHRLTPDEVDRAKKWRGEIQETVIAPLGLDYVEVWNDIIKLRLTPEFYRIRWHGQALAAIAHALAPQIGTYHVASGNPAWIDIPHGVHFAVDPFLSSRKLRIEHHGAELGRLDKVRRLIDHPVHHRMFVCLKDMGSGRNCGKCGKCLRTRLELLVLGALGDCEAFEGDDVRVEEMVEEPFGDVGVAEYYRELVGPLRDIGRPELSVRAAAAADEIARPEWRRRLGRRLRAAGKRWRRFRVRAGRRRRELIGF